MEPSDNNSVSKRKSIFGLMIVAVILIAMGIGVWKSLDKKKTKDMATISINIAFEYGLDDVTEQELRKHITFLDDDGNPIDYEIVEYMPSLFDKTTISYTLTDEQLSVYQTADFNMGGWMEQAFVFKPDDVNPHNVPLNIKMEGYEGIVNIDYLVVDTQAPYFTKYSEDTMVKDTEEVMFTRGEAQDRVDGPVDVDWIGDYDLSKPGRYPIQEVAIDKHGNKTINHFTITVIHDESGDQE